MSFFLVPDIQDTVFYWILRKWMVVGALVGFGVEVGLPPTEQRKADILKALVLRVVEP